jgi:hypothetical protein
VTGAVWRCVVNLTYDAARKLAMNYSFDYQDGRLNRGQSQHQFDRSQRGGLTAVFDTPPLRIPIAKGRKSAERDRIGLEAFKLPH